MKQTCKQLSISPHPMGRGAIKSKALGKKSKEIGKKLKARKEETRPDTRGSNVGGQGQWCGWAGGVMLVGRGSMEQGCGCIVA